MRWWRDSLIRMRVDFLIRAWRRTKRPRSEYWGRGGNRFRIRRLRREIRRRRLRCCGCMAMRMMLRITTHRATPIATTRNGRWRYIPELRASTEFLRRLTDWRLCAFCSRTRQWGAWEKKLRLQGWFWEGGGPLV